jgi:chromosome segregation ATPase
VDPTEIALVLTITGGLATTVWGINGGWRWTRRQFIKVREMWRNQKQMRADVQALQVQVGALNKLVLDMSQVQLEALRQEVTDLATKLDKEENFSQRWSNTLIDRTRDMINKHTDLKEVVDEHTAALADIADLRESASTMQTAIDDLQKTTLKLEAAHIHVETDQQQALNAVREDLARLTERFNKIAKDFWPHP